MDGDNYDNNAVRIGVTMHLDGSTLFVEDRTGPSFTTPMLDAWKNNHDSYYP